MEPRIRGHIMEPRIVTREDQEILDPVYEEAFKIWGNTPRYRLACDLITRAFVLGKYRDE